MTKTEVVIIGAGPTGLSLALQFRRYGIDFIILEKNAGPTKLSKALVVQARTLEIFQELDIAEKAIQEGSITTALNLFYKGKKRVAININGLGEGLSAFPFALSLEQSKTEKLLADNLFEYRENIKWNSEFIQLEQTANGVAVYYKDDNGHEQEIEAMYLVGCDGASSAVRHQLGLAFEGTTEPKLFYVSDVQLKSPVIKNELYMYMIKKGFVLFFPMEGDGHYRVIGVLPEDRTEDEIEFDSIAPGIKEQIITPVDFEKVRWFSSYKVHSRKADAFMKGRCLIAGDAAHIHTPAGGQGMNTGIQDAYNLAWKIAYTLKEGVSTEILKTYDSERAENAKHLLQTTDRMFDIMSGANRFWNFVRLTFFPTLLRWITKSELLKKKIFPLLSQIGIAYPNSSLTIKSSVGKVKAGDRMHYFVFSNGTQIFQYLAEPAFKLLYFGDGNKKDFSDVKLKLTNYSFQEIPKNIFGGEKDFYILLRPDNHISYIGKDLSQCRVLLNKIAGH
jgi:2-polyprenyl-6-methoxyphenol hydroxylase-like FAD-dependent oxidoreductase